MNDVSMNGILTASNAITTDVGYPYYQSLGTQIQNILYTPLLLHQRFTELILQQ